VRSQTGDTQPELALAPTAPRDLEAEQDRLLLRLDSTVSLSRCTTTVRQRPLAAWFRRSRSHTRSPSELDLDTGLLPVDALWCVKAAGGARVAIWAPPPPRSVKLQERYGEPTQTLRLTMPGLEFHRLAWRSRSRRHADDLLALWIELHRQPTYPLVGLVPALRLGDCDLCQGRLVCRTSRRPPAPIDLLPLERLVRQCALSWMSWVDRSFAATSARAALQRERALSTAA
jgi:hypothetical protein